MKLIYILIISLLACKTASKNPKILIETSLGSIEAEIYLDKAPKTATAFLQFVDKGVYKNTQFYRVLTPEILVGDNNRGIIQGGTWPLTSPHATNIPHESTKQTGLTHTDGALSIARADTGTASTEFFICLGNQTYFDYGRIAPEDGLGMACFGKVSNMNIVYKIHKQPATDDNFKNPIKIINIRRL
jgi:peptidyl-prolyl cis-trans isomerase A (cyclophilin A)